MSVEAIVSLGTAWTSHSPALLAFGGGSLIELLSAAVVFWRFHFTLGEARAARIAGGLLFALAGFVVMTSVLNFIGNREAQRSHVGIGILLAAAVVVMPWLALRLPTFVSASSGVVGSSSNSKPTRKTHGFKPEQPVGDALDPTPSPRS
jgi:predicted ABC-type sugar transport system permease subunit